MTFSSFSTRLAILFALLAVMSPLWAETGLQPEDNASALISALTDSLVTSRPVIPDVRCGEWTPALERELRKALLLKNADVREPRLGLLEETNSLVPLAMESDFGVNADILLKMLELQSADLLELTLEQSIQTGERRNVFSYSRYRMPVYRFVLKQISLPEQKLVSIREYTLKGEPELENPGSLLALKWYEPVLAGAILGSLVYMLWTLN